MAEVDGRHGHHRNHHQYSDEPQDVHSPRQRGFFWSHVGWILVRKHDVIHWDRIPDLARYPELRFLTRYDMDMVFRAHPAPAGPGTSNGLSLDHAMWFHRPVRFDRWHLHTQEAVAVGGGRGLARGAIHDADGRLTATVTQEVLVL